MYPGSGYGRCPARDLQCGPASKIIGPRIARQHKVTLDLGHASDSWLLEKLHKEALEIQAEQSSQEMQHVG